MSIRMLSIVLLAMATSAHANQVQAADDPVAVVEQFNQAITNSELDTLLGLFANGAVQFALRPAHAGMPVPEKITSDLTIHWRTIGPVLFSVMESYSRTPEILDTHVENELATVWARITTRSRDRNGTTERSESFREVYLLVNRGEGWKIGGIAENRGTDELVID